MLSSFSEIVTEPFIRNIIFSDRNKVEDSMAPQGHGIKVFITKNIEYHQKRSNDIDMKPPSHAYHDSRITLCMRVTMSRRYRGFGNNGLIANIIEYSPFVCIPLQSQETRKPQEWKPR